MHRMLKRCVSLILISFLACLPLFEGCAAAEENTLAGDDQMNDMNLDESAALDLIEKFHKDLIDAQTFLKSFRDLNVFSSTPFGETKDGTPMGYFVPAGNETAYFPVFTSAEKARAYFDKGDRNGYLLFVGSFMSSLESTKELNEDLREKNFPVRLGVIINPDNNGITIDVSMLDKIIEMLK